MSKPYLRSHSLRVVSLHAAFLLLSASAAFAQATTPGAPQDVTTSGMLGRMAIMFLMVFFIFHVLVIKPQKRKADEQAKLVNDLRKGDQVSTVGGIIGRVIAIEKEAITVEIAANVRVKFEPTAVVRRVDPAANAEKNNAETKRPAA